ncbi:MAG TPA: A/G-specific adenine glycosylase [Candidatus Acidoferrum sp.]|nr:A/G-specific adenine glycosylase [Candidatus Acidoferrum sp.]
MSPNSKLKIQNLKLQKLIRRLLEWFAGNARDLPWRRTRDPYAVWVSEIMLQQTQVKTVIPYWNRWMRALPTIEAVAKASPDKIHKLWEGLGYYTRARNLQQAARQIVAEYDGKFPNYFEDVLALPGIGRYTAGAICSIAFGQPVPVLDGNVIRVLTRIFDIRENPRDKETNARLWRLAEDLVTNAGGAKLPRAQTSFAGDPFASKANQGSSDSPPAENENHSHLNQSLMELGALVCGPRNPQCGICPVKQLCLAFQENRVDQLPNLGRRSSPTAKRFVAFAVERNGRFLIRQRPAGVVNAQLWEFPNGEIGPRLSGPQRGQSQEAAGQAAATRPMRRRSGSGDPHSEAITNAAVAVLGVHPEKLTPLGMIKHSITRYRITLEVWRADFGRPSSAEARFGLGRPGTPPSEPGLWKTPAQMRRLAFSAAHKSILAMLHADRPGSA